MKKENKDISTPVKLATLGVLAVAIFAGYSMYWYFSQPYTRRINHDAPVMDVPLEKNISKDNTSNNVVTSKKEDKYEDNNFKPRYFIIYSSLENLSLPNTPRFSLKVSLPLGLSENELKQNLSHAAWRLLKEKNAKAVIIWGYRDDDKLRAGGFTAGKCILAPFGDWSKATQKHTLNDMQETFEFTEVYDKNIHILPIKSNVIINNNNTTLYSDQYLEDDKTIAKLKKGTKAIIIDHIRDFSTFYIADIYKIQVQARKNRNYTGWVTGDNLMLSNASTTKTQNIYRKDKNYTGSTTIDKNFEWLLNTDLNNKTIAEWRIASEDNKIAICGVFLLLAYKEKLLKLTLLNEANVKDYAKILASNVDTVIKSADYNWNNLTVPVALALITKEIGWLYDK